jgi:hypothetical protein
LGTWVSEDPNKDGVNWQRYVENDPANATDSSGLRVFSFREYEIVRANTPAQYESTDREALYLGHRPMLLQMTGADRVGTASRRGVRHVDWKTITLVLMLENIVGAAHTGIAIEDEYYDLGPGDPEMDGRTPTTPWWDQRFRGMRSSADLNSIIGNLQQFVGSEDKANVFVVVRWDVPIGFANAVERYWEARYATFDDGSETFSLVGENCTTTAWRSIHPKATHPVGFLGTKWEPAQGVPSWVDTMTPGMILGRFRNLRHTAGPNLGKLVKADVSIVTPPE